MGESFSKARDSDALALSARKAAASLAHGRVPSLLQTGGHLVKARDVRGAAHLLGRCVGAPRQHVLLDGSVEQVHVLEHEGYLLHELVGTHVAHVHPADRNAALGNVPETRDQPRQRRLSRAGRAH